MTTALQALRILRAICTATGLALLAAGRYVYAHRVEILDTIARVIFAIEAAARWCWCRRHHVAEAALLTLLATLAAAGTTYRAGQATRHAIHQLSQRSCQLLPAQPLPALAPITATIKAAREALARLVARLYPEPALR